MTASPQVSPGRFSWHELMTSDPAAAKPFYQQVVGWTTKSMDMPGMPYSLWLSGEQPVGGVMELTQDAVAMGAPPNWLAYTEVANVDETIAQAEKLGGAVIVPPQTVEGAGRFAILRDPQGAVFGVLTSQNPLGDETAPQPREFSWHELTTTDALAGMDFYRALFGWDKRAEYDMGPMGMYRLFGRDRFEYGGMMDRPPGMEMPPYWLHYISVADSADAAAERAAAAGGKLQHGPMEVPGGDRVAILTDPQGAWFAVHSKPQS